MIIDNDCVSKQAVLDTLSKYEKPCDDKLDFYLDSTLELEEEIKDLPPVTPERPKGEWKSDGRGHIYCTACKQTNVSMWKSAFCPMCGADMTGG